MKEDFLNRVKQYFGDDTEKYLEALNKPLSEAFFLNTKKASAEEILKMVDFDYKKSDLTNNSYYHSCTSIGKTKAYILGLIYPQEIAASMSSKFVDVENIKLAVDMCAAPGGKSINILNRLTDDALLISNEYNHTRCNILSSNLERLGFSNVIVTNKKCDELAIQLKGMCDLVILDAPCSGEGMIRKYPEILDDYSLDNIKNLSDLQFDLLENAYSMLNQNGQLLYSTCTYAFEEDEMQIKSFLNKHKDMKIVNLKTPFSSTMNETIKLSPLNETEGQFICLMIKTTCSNTNKIKYLKTTQNRIVEEFIKKNIDLSNYYLYKYNNHYYLSFIPLIDMRFNVMRYGIYIGDIVNNRFEPSHFLYRSNLLRNKFKYVFDLNDENYEKYIKGYEIDCNLNNNYYLVTYNGYSLGYGKCSNHKLKNKYPKGLRQN